MKPVLSVFFTVTMTYIVNNYITNDYLGLFLMVLTIILCGLVVAADSYEKETKRYGK